MSRGTSRRQWIAPAAFAVAVAALAGYVVISADLAFTRWLHDPLFCDTAEDCSLPWTEERLLLWGTWAALGLALVAAVSISARSALRRMSRRSLGFLFALAATCGVAAIVWT